MPVELDEEVCGSSGLSVSVAQWHIQGSKHWKMFDALVGH